LNAVITLAEFIGGLISGSLALLSDAGHNLSDTLALILGFAGEKAASSRPSVRFSFGLRRLEVIVALVNAVSLLAISIYIAVRAVQRLINPEPIFAPLMLAVALVGLTGNFASIVLLHRFRQQNLNLRAVFLHLFLDTLSSVSVVAAGVLLLFYDNFWWLDPIVSLFIVALVGVSSVGVLVESMRIILQAAPSSIDPRQVARALRELDGVESLHGLHIWAVNSTETFLSCHVCARPEVEHDRLIQNINRMLAERFGIEHSAVQIETTDFCNRQEEKCCR